MAVTDLTGTTWVINEVPDITSRSLYSIDFTYNDGSGDYNGDALDLDDGGWGYLGYDDDVVYTLSDGWQYPEIVRTISITGGTDVTNASLIAWLQVNATQQVRNDYFTCTDELTSIADAIRAKGGTSASLIYPGGFVTAINNLPTKVLGVGTFSGYDSPFDIQVTAQDYSDGNWDGFSSVTVNISTPLYDGSCDIINPLITFTIAGTTYQAEEGMTWAEWVESSYNTDGVVIESGVIKPVSGAQVTMVGQRPTYVIKNGGSYSYAGGGGAN